VDREQWAEKLENFGWLCGRCQKGHLLLDRKLLHDMGTAATQAESSEDYWEPEMGEYRFAALAICNACGDPVAVGGYSKLDRYQIDWDDYVEDYTYFVKSVSPAPLPFPLHENIPEPVANHLRAAAGLLWADHDAAGNKIRQAVEVMLDDRKIKKFTIKPAVAPHSKGSRKAINLHIRIEDYQNKNPDAAKHLMAIKWIGNAGSHSGDEGLTRDQILDALEIMEIVLNEVYVGHRAKIAKKVAKIVASRKPLKAVKAKPPQRP
jgi:hypothetical protein